QRTPLHFACEAGSADCVQELLRVQASVDTRDRDGRTPLHFACIDGSEPCITQLLRAGAPRSSKDTWGRDPEAVAVRMGRAGAVCLLQEDGGGAPVAATGAPRTATAAATEALGQVRAPASGVDWAEVGQGQGDAASRRCGVPRNRVLGVTAEESAKVGSGGGCGGVAVGRGLGGLWFVMNEEGRMLEREKGSV
ncbi:unnamed protein product, partial [Discosporangium mesarthrocarpum]